MEKHRNKILLTIQLLSEFIYQHRDIRARSRLHRARFNCGSVQLPAVSLVVFKIQEMTDRVTELERAWCLSPLVVPY